MKKVIVTEKVIVAEKSDYTSFKHYVTSECKI